MGAGDVQWMTTGSGSVPAEGDSVKTISRSRAERCARDGHARDSDMLVFANSGSAPLIPVAGSFVGHILS